MISERLTSRVSGSSSPASRARSPAHGSPTSAKRNCPLATWSGPRRREWTTSLERVGYIEGVEAIRDLIEQGTVYQVNLCRVLSAPSSAADLSGLAMILAAEHPSRYPALVCLPEVGIQVCSASPELFLSRGRVDGADIIETRPIKGTGRAPADITAKDRGGQESALEGGHLNPVADLRARSLWSFDREPVRSRS